MCLAASDTQNPTLLFISSVSSVLNYAGESEKILESIVSDASSPIPMGYTEIRIVAELLLDHASKCLQLDTRIARVGQIAVDSLGPSLSNVDWLSC